VIRTDLSDELAHVVASSLRAMRLRAGLTQHQVAARSDSWRAIVCRIEQAHHSATLETLYYYALACDGSLAEVLEEVDRCLVARGLLSEKQRLARRPRVSARRRTCAQLVT
jgi:transcriptional regulator with XRE-family HTH domain